MKLSQRVKKRWQCSAVEVGHDTSEKVKYSLTKKRKTCRGEKIWTVGHNEADLERLNDWVGAMKASRLGGVILWREKGIPMGNSMSPIRASLCLCECERRAWTQSAKSNHEGFGDGDVTVQQTIAGRRIADDTTLVSKQLCMDYLVLPRSEVCKRDVDRGRGERDGGYDV